jgi:hypothetical protein
MQQSFDMETNKDTKQSLHSAITQELGNFIESKSSTFACGGSITAVGTLRDEYEKKQLILQ